MFRFERRWRHRADTIFLGTFVKKEVVSRWSPAAGGLVPVTSDGEEAPRDRTCNARSVGAAGRSDSQGRRPAASGIGIITNNLGATANFLHTRTA
jgi:hypothetical protein